MAITQAPLGGTVQTSEDAGSDETGTLASYLKGGPEGAALALMQKRAAAQQAAQQQMLGTLQQQEGALGQQGMSDYDKASLLFQAAGALGKPTRSGGFGETLGNLGEAMAGPLSKEAEKQRARTQQLQQLQLARQKLGMEMAGQGVSAQDMMSLIKSQRDNEEEKPTPSEFERVISQLTPQERAKAMRLKAGLPLDDVAPKGVPQEVMDLGPKAVADYVSARAKEVAKGTTATQEQAPPIDPLVTGIPPVAPEFDFSKRIQDPKQRAIWMARNRDAGGKLLDKEETGVKADEDKLNEMKRFIQINEANQGNTGPGAQYAYALSNPNTEMTKIANFIAPSLRNPGSGATSNFDAKQFLKSTVSTGNDFAVNRNIGLAYITAKQNQRDYVDFRREYLEQNGTLEGSARQWKNYLESNSIFKEPKGKTSKDVANVELNPERMYYRDWFRQQLAPKSVKRDQDGNLVLGGD